MYMCVCVCVDAGPRIDLVECVNSECYKSYPDSNCKYLSNGGRYMLQEQDFYCSAARSVSSYVSPRSVCASVTCVIYIRQSRAHLLLLGVKLFL